MEKNMKIKATNHNATLVTLIHFFLLSRMLKVFNTKFAISRHITSFFYYNKPLL